MEFEIIKNLNEEIIGLYELINSLIETIDKTHEENNEKLSTLIQSNNSNITLVNRRLNQMDLDILDADKEQSIKKDKLVKDIDKQLKEERKNNNLYKIGLTKRIIGLNKENDNKIKLVKVEASKNNKNKDLQLQIRTGDKRMKQYEDDFINHKKQMIKSIEALKREIKIRTRENKEIKIKGLNII